MLVPQHTKHAIHDHLSIVCHLTRAKLLSIQIIIKYTKKHTTAAITKEIGLFQRKNKEIHRVNNTFSHQCMISTLPKVEPLISVVVPLTIS